MLKKEELKEVKRNLKMAWQFIKNKKKTLIILIILSALLSGIGVIIPLLTAKLVLNLSTGILDKILYYALFIFFAEVFRNLIYYLFDNIKNKYTLESRNDVQIKMFEETIKIKISEIDKSGSGTFIDRITNDSYEIIVIFSGLASSFVDFISNVGILIAIYILNKYIFAFFLLSSFVIWLINNKRMNNFFERNNRIRLVREKQTGLIIETIRGIKDVKLLNGNKGILDKLQKQFKEVSKKQFDNGKYDSKYFLISGSVRDLLDVLFFVLSIILIKYSNLTIATLIVLYMYKDKMENLIKTYNRIIDEVKDFNLSATRVYEILGDKFIK